MIDVDSLTDSQRAGLRRQIVATVRLRDRACVAASVWPGVTCRLPLDAHEIIPRSAWAKGIYVLDNVVLVCRAHHDYIDDHPTDAHEVGLHGYSHERPDYKKIGER